MKITKIVSVLQKCIFFEKKNRKIQIHDNFNCTILRPRVHQKAYIDAKSKRLYVKTLPEHLLTFESKYFGVVNGEIVTWCGLRSTSAIYIHVFGLRFS